MVIVKDGQAQLYIDIMRIEQYFQCNLFAFIVIPHTTIVPRSINQTYHRGESALLMCSNLGGPNNTYQWQANHTDISGETMPVLTLADVGASTGGMYTCVVTNAAGSDYDSTFLFIAPYFIIEPVNEEIINGSTVTLQCVAEAFPSPSYLWTRTNGLPIREVFNTESLTISPVLFGDEGDYYCNTTSRDEVAHSQDATLTSEKSHLLVLLLLLPKYWQVKFCVLEFLVYLLLHVITKAIRKIFFLLRV